MRFLKRPLSFSFFNFSPPLFYSPSRISAKPSPSLANAATSPGVNRLRCQYLMDGNDGIDVHDGRSVELSGSDSGKKPCVLSSLSPRHGCKTDIGKQIFCNRSLNMKNIVAVGFDMDYTLAQYKPETFESLAYQGTIKKLVYDLGYPRELLNWTFDWKYMVRGLVLDKKRGNILKMDRHKYVKVAYHGFKELSKEDKVGTYGNTLVRDSFDEPDYALIDTLFSLAEAYLFAQLVDFKDGNPGKIQEGVDYARMYKDVRAAVDLCHRDGTLKQMVAKDPKRYINEDTAIVPMLEMLRESGRATFLVTNSLWDYTNIVMNFLCQSKMADGTNNFNWLQYFDVVITGSAKPGFFHEENRANLFQVVPETGMLLNTDNGSPMPQVGDNSARLIIDDGKHACPVFQGGSVGHLHKLLSVESSSQVLYVGDHIYGDILRSKKALGWRTMLVIPELEKEIKLLWESRDTRKEDFYMNSLVQELQFLRSERNCIEDGIHHLRFKNPSPDAKQNLSSELDKLELERERVRLSHQEAQRKLHQRFHEPWGQLLKTGYQNSRFAHQVERFACLYTSKVSNLALYSPDKYYRPSEDFMQHEFGILAYEPGEM
ncbi:PREDICTED: 5'-nucleotidase domain-containing protein 4-like isoform X2 [Lupinus angustifolius]|uniref:5'-nucleotidase domain-containing protein 4-like isoform X2 n=1 Tax=Lupinus angustifolius TaxID=3871 RepID=UPI00092F4E67|nr:PREDICTED: 5'-nucleotidase domain-containing protein 4-like isoform X2 [Lupinus angustifolius]